MPSEQIQSAETVTQLPLRDLEIQGSPVGAMTQNGCQKGPTERSCQVDSRSASEIDYFAVWKFVCPNELGIFGALAKKTLFEFTKISANFSPTNRLTHVA